MTQHNGTFDVIAWTVAESRILQVWMVRVLVHELFQGDVDAPHKNKNSILRHDLLVGMLLWQNSYHCDVKKTDGYCDKVNGVTDMFASPFNILVLSSESM